MYVCEVYKGGCMLGDIAGSDPMLCLEKLEK